MIKVGIVGSGFGLYGLLPAFNSTPNCKVISICGSESERMLDYCMSIGLKKIYRSWQEMLDKEDLEAIALAVTPNAQYEIAKAAIEKGLHIFAEKPLTATLEQAQELLQLASQKKIVHAIDFLFPEIEEWKKVKKLLDKKVCGNLKQINLKWDFLSYDIKNQKSSWKTNTAEGGGALSFYFSHSLYYLEYFAGKIFDLKSRLSYASKSPNGGDVGVDLQLEFENGVLCNAHINCNSSDVNKHQLEFICDEGTINLENENNITSNFIIKIKKNGEEKQLPLPHEQNIEGEDERVRIVRKLATRFINSIIQEKQFIPSFNEGVRVQELIEKIRNQNVT
ncbi:hypothetical protein A3C59_00545 [Candidatus Daviesbacteria bacterium RIFCSPHIGHO2_02_FULL_36_13]|uniref:Gfo/Idh/MocA-like oxidoreductase N-terminal domain-containing protein n=1 Tax=Candidatus Daviesbacteria bacterium RIFCSPHIGHO2_02_FULL_36_13 TaxID=1797768 RepID=A0A1F5JPA0_9BACT|nr:MAG: hypothetical protein A3C59_00545 [Candidatus Daviesbacteria bacterium RIFCSPHIGHO2_02_FULL_36_13]